MPDWIFTAAWVFIIVWFLIWEALALIRKRRGDTLSEHVWEWFNLKGKKSELKWWEAVLRVAFLMFWAWLTFHFVFGGAIV